jgi:Helix-turn-helix domain
MPSRPIIPAGTSERIKLSTETIGRLFTEEQAAEYLQQKVKTLQAKRVSGGGAPFVKLGRSVRYRMGDLHAYIASNVRLQCRQGWARTQTQVAGRMCGVGAPVVDARGRNGLREIRRDPTASSAVSKSICAPALGSSVTPAMMRDRLGKSWPNNSGRGAGSRLKPLGTKATCESKRTISILFLNG